MVVLVGGSHNVTVNVTRVFSTACATKTITLTTTLTHAFGFDIESDGSVGNTQLPGILTTTNLTKLDLLCQPNKVISLPLLSECSHVYHLSLHITLCTNLY